MFIEYILHYIENKKERNTCSMYLYCIMFITIQRSSFDVRFLENVKLCDINLAGLF